MHTTTVEYEPIDLTPVFTAPADIMEDPHEITLGQRTLHGLPFSFGTPDAAFAIAAPGGAPVTVAVSDEARWLVFAHAVLEPHLFEGGSIGETVGAYRVVFDDGESVDVPLRQRFEIGPTPRKWSGRALPLDWGQTPFLAVNDAEHELMDRTCGRYDEAGARLVEIEDPQSRVPYVLPYRFYLWAWQNPRPDARIERIELRGERHTIVLGALTRSVLDEEPLIREVARETLFTFADGEADETVSIEVDRGSSTYLYKIARSQPHPGLDVSSWGGTRERDDIGYARIAAAPSATVTVRRGAEVLGSFRWRDLVEHGELAVSASVTAKLPSADRSWVTGEVRDADTGELVACRIRFESADGIPFAPYAHHAHINSDGGTWNLDIGGDVRLGAHTYAFIDGRFEGWLPDGEVAVELARGFTYRPVRRTITVGPDSTRFTLEVQREFDPLARGYAGGDTHVHFVSTKGAELEARAEDLEVVNLLQTQWGHLFTSTEEFSGRPEQSPDGRTIVFTGQENRTNMLGHINLLGIREPIFPWCTGGSEEADLGGGLETTLSRWADECHAQGGTVVLAHFPVPYGETAALLATGRLDAVETIAFDHYNMNEYYRYLNAGFRMPLAAGTDKMTAEVPIGMMRTYAAVDDPSQVDYWAWSRGIKSGNTMVTSGPLLWLTADGAPIGSVVQTASGSTVQLAIELETVFPVSEIEVIVDGRIEARLPVPEGATRHQVEHAITVHEDSWVAVRCFGRDAAKHHDNWERPVFAHTSPIYFATAGEYAKTDEGTLRNMLSIVEGARRYVTERARTNWAGSATQRHGQADHMAWLVEPFDEATRALHDRLAAAGFEA
ncbi:CehA/McbA family metallohydrolase [Ruicaihuangia caeni]|uniref:CehA/McbA family metallohydrolase n=1 Tax=Ruicaihuangia caeni TaxID=3042517 RepID=UPI003390683C